MNVAIPQMSLHLNAGLSDVLWILNAYILVYAVLLITAGRLGDLYGPKQLFLAGLIIFTAASAACGIAQNPTQMIIFRIVQGLGGALLTPQTLSTITMIFPPSKRGAAFGLWGAVAGVSTVAGPTLGGWLVTDYSWRWIFFVNVPVGVAAFFLAPRLLQESRDMTVKSFDALGAVLVTGGLVSLVYAITQSGTYGWGSARTIGVIALSTGLLVGFVLWERRHAEPLMRFGILRTKTVAGANVGGLILGTATFSMFLMLTLYMQQVLGYSPMKTGVAYLAVAGSAILWSGVAAQLVNRVGVKPVLVTGMVALTSGLVYFTQVSVHGSYLGDLLPGFLLVGVGLGFSFVPISIAALAGVSPAEAGLASGLFNTSQQIGGALGIAVLSTIATSRTSDALAGGSTLPSALIHGFTGAFVVGVGIAAVGVLAALTLIRRDELEHAPAELEPVLDLAA